ncbi:MAG: DUF6508 domain-containing protein [Methanobacteriaceae archaeon]|nr:DUF6508 domain-containing protein [Methanobacteriaceae archaeon]
MVKREELEEIWTNYDRQVVENYVKIRLHHYLFTKILKDHEEIMCKVIEIHAQELDYFKAIHLLKQDEFQKLVNKLPDLEEYFTNEDNQTTPSKEILEVIKYMLVGVDELKITPLTHKNFDQSKIDELNSLLTQQKKTFADVLNKPYFQETELCGVIDENTLEIASKNTDEFLNMAKIYELYDQLFVFPNKLELYNVIIEEMVYSLTNDKLFELYVLLNTLEVLGTTKGKVTFENAGVRALAKFYKQVEEDGMEHTTNMEIFFHDLPEELNAKFKPLLIYPYICIKMTNSVTAKNLTRISYLLLEIERITDNQIKYKCKATEDIRNMLVVWDHRLFNDEKSHIKVVDHKTLQVGLNKAFGNILKYPNVDNLDVVLDYIPYFEEEGTEYYKLIDGTRFYDEEADFFKDDLFQENIYKTFDYLSDWESTGWNYINNHDLIKRLDLLTLQKLIYLILEKEKLREGILGKLMDDGTVLMILKRLKELREVNDSELKDLYSPYRKLKCCPIHDPDLRKDD